VDPFRFLPTWLFLSSNTAKLRSLPSHPHDPPPHPWPTSTLSSVRLVLSEIAFRCPEHYLSWLHCLAQDLYLAYLSTGISTPSAWPTPLRDQFTSFFSSLGFHLFPLVDSHPPHMFDFSTPVPPPLLPFVLQPPSSFPLPVQFFPGRVDPAHIQSLFARVRDFFTFPPSLLLTTTALRTWLDSLSGCPSSLSFSHAGFFPSALDTALPTLALIPPELFYANPQHDHFLSWLPWAVPRLLDLPILSDFSPFARQLADDPHGTASFLQ
jgi:hypothetical protein